MKSGLIKIDVSGMSRTEWLAQRRKGLGGSDAAAALGISPWVSPLALYLDKTGQLPDQEETEALRIGRDLEEYVAKRFQEASGYRVRKCNFLLKDPEHPFLHANIDREISGMDAGLECKTASAFKSKMYRGGAFPDNYYLQCVHYLSVTGMARWFLAVLVMGVEFKVFLLTTQAEDEKPDFCESMVYVPPEEIAALRAGEIAFWQEHVEKGLPPQPDGSPSSADALQEAFPEDGDAAPMDMTLYHRELTEYVEAQARKKEAETAFETAKQKLMQCMGDCPSGESEGYRVSYKTQRRQTFDWKALAKDQPALNLAPYFRESLSRPLKVTPKTKEE